MLTMVEVLRERSRLEIETQMTQYLDVLGIITISLNLIIIPFKV